MKDRHILIVGGGLAGIAVAFELLKKNYQITLIDKGVNYSSKIAAGMINPLVFRRMTKSWRVDEFIPYLNTFYKDVETLTGKPFHHPIKIRRMFSSQQEREFWEKKQDLPDFKSYMEHLTEDDNHFSGAINSYGSGRVKQASYIDTHIFLSASKTYLSKHVNWVEEEFEYSALNHSVYKDISFDDIVFCEGYLGCNNPYFNRLPLHQTKGETLLIRSKTLPEDQSVNRKCFVLPLGNQTFKIGSTYIWNTINPSPTEEGKTTLLKNLSFLTEENVEILEHEGGVRPTTDDRRPLIGTHETHKNYHIFNGLGTKGYMIAPLLAKEFVNYLSKEGDLHPETKISRFNKATNATDA